MINGLQIDVPADELKQMLLGRLKYHTDKVQTYTKQYEDLKKFEAGLAEEARRIGKTSTATPLENMEEAIKRHSNQCVYYRFMADHVVPSETYRLSENDLTRLGISNNHHY